jgi:hypothetical protein
MRSIDRIGAALAVLAGGAVLGVPIGIYLSGNGDLSAWLGFWGGATGAIATVASVLSVELYRSRAQNRPHHFAVLRFAAEAERHVSGWRNIIQRLEVGGDVRKTFQHIDGVSKTLRKKCDDVVGTSGPHIGALVTLLEQVSGRMDSVEFVLDIAPSDDMDWVRNVALPEVDEILSDCKKLRTAAEHAL